jgi:hypothetical protein|tara:strand:- start:105 stop:338 length:234 start_codon:yes stop_codon:yes gene_type:complete
MKLFVYVVTEILLHSESELSVLRVVAFGLFFLMILLHFGSDSSFFGLIPPNDRHNDAPVDAISDTEANSVEKNENIG